VESVRLLRAARAPVRCAVLGLSPRLDRGLESVRRLRAVPARWSDTVSTFRETLIALDACHSAIKWVGERDLETAWAECPRGHWMLWLAEMAGVDRASIDDALSDIADVKLGRVVGLEHLRWVSPDADGPLYAQIVRERIPVALVAEALAVPRA